MSVDVLVIVGGNKTADIEAMKAIYGGSATIQTARTADDLVAAIKSNSPMRRLVIATHGSEGDVIIGGVHTSIKKLASSIRSSAVPPKVREALASGVRHISPLVVGRVRHSEGGRRQSPR